MGIEELVVKHRLERGEIAAAHRRIALVIEGEDFLVAAHRQTSLAVSPGTSGLHVCCAPSLAQSACGRAPAPRHSPNGIYGMSCGHSGLMLAPRIPFAHFAVSSAMSFSKSAGEPLNTVPPCSTSLALIIGSA